MNQNEKVFEEPNGFSKVIAGRISTQLSRHNWSLKTLSDRSTVPYETIKKVANGKIRNPSLKNIFKIAEAFDCSIDYLAGRTPLHKRSRSLRAKTHCTLPCTVLQ